MTDAIDLAAAVLTPASVRDYPVTTAITSLTLNHDGLDVVFAKRDGKDWPDVTPSGWGGPVYYTVFIGAQLGDAVHLAASLNVYRGQKPGSGAGDVTDFALQPALERAPGQYSNNLWYLDGALGQHHATEGETLYLMVVAGGWRGITAESVRERSNVVAFTARSVPTVFTFSDVPPVVIPPVVPPPVDPPPTTNLDARLAAIEAKLAQILAVRAPVYEGTVTVPYLGTGKVVLTPKGTP